MSYGVITHLVCNTLSIHHLPFCTSIFCSLCLFIIFVLPIISALIVACGFLLFVYVLTAFLFNFYILSYHHTC